MQSVAEYYAEYGRTHGLTTAENGSVNGLVIENSTFQDEIFGFTVTGDSNQSNYKSIIIDKNSSMEMLVVMKDGREIKIWSK